MRHKKLSKKLNRDTSLRYATIRGIVSGLLVHQRISTTLTKAKVARPFAERLITLGKRGDLGSQNRAMQLLTDKPLVQKLFKEIAPLFKNRSGGYTRIMLKGTRRGDGATTVILELTEKKEVIPVKPKEKKKEVKELKPQRQETPQKEEKKPKEAAAVKEEKKEIIKIQEEVAKEKAKSETKHLEKGFLKGIRRYFRPKGNA